jgi:hypothetical protein
LSTICAPANQEANQRGETRRARIASETDGVGKREASTTAMAIASIAKHAIDHFIRVSPEVHVPPPARLSRRFAKHTVSHAAV